MRGAPVADREDHPVAGHRSRLFEGQDGKGLSGILGKERVQVRPACDRSSDRLVHARRVQSTGRDDHQGLSGATQCVINHVPKDKRDLVIDTLDDAGGGIGKTVAILDHIEDDGG